MTRWQNRLDRFVEEHSNDGANNKDSNNTEAKPDILFVVNPSSAGGKPMALYSTCLEELEKTGRRVEVFISKCSEDVIGLSKNKDLAAYQAIVVLSGDSTLYEMVQAPLLENHGKWPYAAPIVMLPGGTVNVIATENFGAKALPQQIIQHTLSNNSSNNNNSQKVVKKASVMHLSSESATSRYILHHAAGGIMQKVLAYAEQRRADIYPIFGKIGLLLAVLFHLPFLSTQDIPGPFVFMDIWNSDVEAGKDMGFGVRRFDCSNMTVATIEKDQNPGKWAIFVKVLAKLLSGSMAKAWRDGKAPEYLTIQTTDQYSYKVPVPREESSEGGVVTTTIFGDGSNKVPFISTDDKIQVECIVDALPFLTVKDQTLLNSEEATAR